MKIISITGTKGKTSVARIIDYVLRNSNKTTLRVDNDGHYINGKRKSTLDDSINFFGKTPSVCPGKYLITMKRYFPDFTAILECSIGSAGEGLGYRFHDVGIFTNVYFDHIKKEKGIKTRRDLANRKSFIFEKINDNGYIIFNADDKFVCSQLDKIPKLRKDIKLLPVGINFKYFDIESYLNKNGECFILRDNEIFFKNKNEEKKVIDASEVSWTFNGNYPVAISNLIYSIAGIYAHNDCTISEKDIDCIKNFKFEASGGRMSFVQNKNGANIILDYAHEEKSLIEIGKLANKLKKGKSIGVLRLAPGLRNKTILSISKKVSKIFDEFIIYDKINGINRKRYFEKVTGFSREIGETAHVFSDYLSRFIENNNIFLFVNEEDAIKKSAEISKKGDVVVIIRGDYVEDSWGYVKKFFKVDFF